MNRSNVMKGLAAAVTAVVVASLIGAAFVLESPMKQRERRLDNRRLEDIWSIEGFIQRYAKKHGKLPQDMKALEEEALAAGTRRPPSDPVTQAPYEYKVLDEQSFQLCAVFSLPSRKESDYSYYPRWERAHDSGKQCFQYTLNKDTKDTDYY